MSQRASRRANKPKLLSRIPDDTSSNVSRGVDRRRMMTTSPSTGLLQLAVPRPLFWLHGGRRASAPSLPSTGSSARRSWSDCVTRAGGGRPVSSTCSQPWARRPCAGTGSRARCTRLAGRRESAHPFPASSCPARRSWSDCGTRARVGRPVSAGSRQQRGPSPGAPRHRSSTSDSSSTTGHCGHTGLLQLAVPDLVRRSRQAANDDDVAIHRLTSVGSARSGARECIID